MGRNYWVPREHSAQRSLGIGRDSRKINRKQSGRAVRGWGDLEGSWELARSGKKPLEAGSAARLGSKEAPEGTPRPGVRVPSLRRERALRPPGRQLLPRPRARSSGPGPARPGLTAPTASCSSAPSRLSMTAARLPAPCPLAAAAAAAAAAAELPGSGCDQEARRGGRGPGRPAPQPPPGPAPGRARGPAPTWPGGAASGASGAGVAGHGGARSNSQGTLWGAGSPRTNDP